MRSNSWDNTNEARKGGRSGSWGKRLLLVAAGLIAIPILIGMAFGGVAMSHRGKLWPAVRQIHARLQTDEGARDLYLKNPSLAEAYGSPQAFLDSVHTWRDKVGELPAQEPVEGKQYEVTLDPSGGDIQVSGSGGAWMRVEIQGGAFAEPGLGEGIVRLLFSEEQRGLERAETRLRDERDKHTGEAFRQLFQQCAEDTAALALYRKEPGLRDTYRSEQTFLAHLKPLRPAIALMLARPAVEEGKFHFQRRTGPFGSSESYTLDLEDGVWLSTASKDGRLSAIDGRASAGSPAGTH